MFRIGLVLKEYLAPKPEHIEFYLHKDGWVTSACWGGELFEDIVQAETAIKILEEAIKRKGIIEYLLPYSCVKITEDGIITTLAVVW